MQLALLDGVLYIKTTREEYPIVKGLPGIKWNKKALAWEGAATLELLERLKKFVKLPASVETERVRLEAKQERIDAERLNDNPVPMYDYPVKVKLYTHQIRGANMAMYQFGWERLKQ